MGCTLSSPSALCTTPDLSDKERSKMIVRLDRFKENDFKVTLGSVLESDIRTYYIENRFNHLKQKLGPN